MTDNNNKDCKKLQGSFRDFTAKYNTFLQAFYDCIDTFDVVTYHCCATRLQSQQNKLTTSDFHQEMQGVNVILHDNLSFVLDKYNRMLRNYDSILKIYSNTLTDEDRRTLEDIVAHGNELLEDLI